MPTVYLPVGLSKLTCGMSPLEVAGKTVREVIHNLDRAWPGVRESLVDQDRMRSGISVAVDGVVSPVGLLQDVSAESEIHFVAAIAGG